MTLEKQFFNKRKTVSYSADVWYKAEEFFNTLDQAKLNGEDVEIHLGGETYLISNIWGEYQRRYTGIHAYDEAGNIKKQSGVNLDDDEWAMLKFNFTSIKEALTGKKDAFKNIFIRPKEDLNIVKVYKADWFLNGKVITNSTSGREFFSHEKAEQYAMCRKPVPGIDYPQKDVHAQLRVDCQVRPAPEDTMLMNFVLVETMNKMIEAEVKANCEACQMNLDSQFDHCRSGNCLDEDLNQIDLYLGPAHKKIKINILMNVFDQLRKDMGLKPIMSAQLAKCALAFIPKLQIANQLQDVALYNSLLMETVRSAYISVINQ